MPSQFTVDINFSWGKRFHVNTSKDKFVSNGSGAHLHSPTYCIMQRCLAKRPSPRPQPCTRNIVCFGLGAHVNNRLFFCVRKIIGRPRRRRRPPAAPRPARTHILWKLEDKVWPIQIFEFPSKMFYGRVKTSAEMLWLYFIFQVHKIWSPYFFLITVLNVVFSEDLCSCNAHTPYSRFLFNFVPKVISDLSCAKCVLEDCKKNVLSVLIIGFWFFIFAFAKVNFFI